MNLKIFIIYMMLQLVLGFFSHMLSLKGYFEYGIFLNITVLAIITLLLPIISNFIFRETINHIKLINIIFSAITGLFSAIVLLYSFWLLKETSLVIKSDWIQSLIVYFVIFSVNSFTVIIFIYIRKNILKFHF